MNYALTADDLAFITHTRKECGLSLMLDEDERESLALSFAGEQHEFVESTRDDSGSAATGFLTAA